MTEGKATIKPTHYYDAGIWLLERQKTRERIITLDSQFTLLQIKDVVHALGMRLAPLPTPQRVMITIAERFETKWAVNRKWNVSCADTGKLLAVLPAAADEPYHEHDKAVLWAKEQGYSVIDGWYDQGDVWTRSIYQSL